MCRNKNIKVWKISTFSLYEEVREILLRLFRSRVPPRTRLNMSRRQINEKIARNRARRERLFGNDKNIVPNSAYTPIYRPIQVQPDNRTENLSLRQG